MARFHAIKWPDFILNNLKSHDKAILTRTFLVPRPKAPDLVLELPVGIPILQPKEGFVSKESAV